MKLAFLSGAILMLLGVAIGAFGAHGLKNKLDNLGTLATFETGVSYHFYHALGLFAIAWASSVWSTINFNASTYCLIGGVLIFSGSLYMLSITGIKWLGAITPIGGTLFIVGWAIAIYKVYQVNSF